MTFAMTLIDHADVLALLILFVLVVAFVAPTAGGLVQWAREEWRLIQAENWQSDYLVNPRLGSASDDRVARMVLRQRALGRRLRRQGRSLISRERKQYVPELTKPTEAPPPPKADKVVPIRKPVNFKEAAR